MENKSVNFDLLISKKANAEAYKVGIIDLENEIKDIEQKISMSMIKEEKDILQKEKEQKEEELDNLKSTYDDKRENIKGEIEDAKNNLNLQVEEIESKAISREEFDKLNKEKESKESELLECEKDIKEVKDELKDLIDKDNGYEQDTVSLSKKLDSLTAYRTYINEEIQELNLKLEDRFIIEDNLEEFKYVKYMKMRLSNLSYDSIESWVEKENELQEELLEEQDPPRQDPPRQDPPRQDPPRQDPPRQDPPRQDPPRQDPPRQDPPRQDPPRQDPPRQDPPRQDPPRQDPPRQDPPRQDPPKPKPQITTIKIEPWKHQIIIKLDNGTQLAEPTIIEYRNENKDVDKILEEANEKLNNDEYNLDKSYKKLDPNILIMLQQTKNEDVLYKYIKAVCDKNKEELPFNLQYDLEGTSYLDKEERKNIKKVVRSAKKLGADINREKISNRIKAWFISSKQLLLSEKNETNVQEKETIKHEKTKVIDKLRARLPKREKTEKSKKRTNIISKTKSMATSLGRKTICGVKIAGTRFYGYLNGENKLVTEKRVRDIKDKSFVPKAKVDESLALQNVEKNAEENIKTEEPANFIIE